MTTHQFFGTSWGIAAALVCGLQAAMAGPVITPVSQSRTVTSGASASQQTCSGCGSAASQNDQDSESAPGFALFDESVSSSASGGAAGASGSAQQTSEILSTHINCFGSAGCSAVAPLCIGDGCSNNASAFGEGNSRLEVTFTVATPTAYSISGSLSSTQTDFGSAVAAITLTGPGRRIIFADQAVPPGPFQSGFVTLDVMGSLEPGEYTLLIEANAETGGGDASQSASADFSVGVVFDELTCDEIVEPPANDECGSAIPISSGETGFCTTAATDSEPDVINCGNNNLLGADIWFEYTAECTGNLVVSTCNTANFDTKIAVYGENFFGASLCPQKDFPLLGGALLGCNDDTVGCNLGSEVVVPVEEGVLYHIRVGGYVPSSGIPHQGSGTLTIACFLSADLNHDGHVDGADLGLLLTVWGACPECDADLNGDGEVDGADLGLMLAAWTG
jgi:hypothetical protein